MIKQQKYLCFVLVALCCIGWVACTQQRQPCLTPKTASLIIESIHLTTDTSTVPVDTALIAAVFTPLVPGKSASPDTTFSQQSLFTISLSPDDTICQWLFSTDTLTTIAPDTLTFHYQRNLQFLSNACGYTYFYTLDTVITTHRINDSLHIINTSVTNNVNTKHLQIFIRPDY